MCFWVWCVHSNCYICHHHTVYIQHDSNATQQQTTTSSASNMPRASPDVNDIKTGVYQLGRGIHRIPVYLNHYKMMELLFSIPLEVKVQCVGFEHPPNDAYGKGVYFNRYHKIEFTAPDGRKVHTTIHAIFFTFKMSRHPKPGTCFNALTPINNLLIPNSLFFMQDFACVIIIILPMHPLLLCSTSTLNIGGKPSILSTI